MARSKGGAKIGDAVDGRALRALALGPEAWIVQAIEAAILLAEADTSRKRHRPWQVSPIFSGLLEAFRVVFPGLVAREITDRMIADGTLIVGKWRSGYSYFTLPEYAHREPVNVVPSAPKAPSVAAAKLLATLR